MNNVADNIKKFRELKNVTREHMAAELGLSLSGYSKLERGEIDLTLSRLQKISEILSVDLSQILNFDASQIFNVNNTKVINSVGAKAENMNFYGDDYKEKYILMLEEENARLKKLVKE